MKFIHAADLHLDSPLLGLAAYDGAPIERLRGATRRAFEGLIDLAIEEKVDFLVVAGDVYDGEWRDFNTGLYFARQIARLHERGIPVFLLHGNHDAESQITRRLPLPEDTVKIFSAREPQTYSLPHLQVALHGQSFRTRDVTENLAARYPAPVAGAFNIGVLHTALNGRDGHAPYAPCDLWELVNRGYQYWALGHVHGREVLHEHPHVVYCGNLQGRHIREAGRKGCTLVTVRDGTVISAEHRCVDVLRWALVETDLSGCETFAEARGRVRQALERALEQAEGRLLAGRLRMFGVTPLHARLLVERDTLEAEIRALTFELGIDELWIEKVQVATRPARDPRGLGDRPDAVGSLVRLIDTTAEDDEARETLSAVIDELLSRVPSEAFGTVGIDIADLRDPERLPILVAEAKEVILARLLDAEEGAP